MGLSLNDETDYGLCFACGPRNPWGLKLLFDKDGDKVTTSFISSEEYQGYPGYLHGGITSALLDEVMSRVSLLDQQWTMTARMEVRFKLRIPIGAGLTAEAVKVSENGRFLEARGTLMLPNGQVAATSMGTYAYVNAETLRSMAHDYPGLVREWMK